MYEGICISYIPVRVGCLRVRGEAKDKGNNYKCTTGLYPGEYFNFFELVFQTIPINSLGTTL